MCYRFLETQAEAHIFWAHAGTLTKFVQACRSIAEELRVPGWSDPKSDVLQLVHHWLGSDQNGKWLFVLDNFDDVQLLDETLPSSIIQNTLYLYFPRVTNGAIVVTTRDRRVGERLAVRGKTTVVSAMTTIESVQLLRSYLASSIDVTTDDLERLVEALDRLPLAITQAAAYMTEQVITVEEYFSMLQDEDEDMQELLSESLSDDRRTDGESNSVIKTWKLSFDQITKQNLRAAQMLSLMAMFDRQGIPSTLLKRKDEPKRVFIRALALLQNFSLITKGPQAETYEMHRLVQLSTQAWLEVQKSTTIWRNEALHILVEQFPNGSKIENWGCWETLSPHARTIVQFNILSTDAWLDRAELLEHLASFDTYQGHNETAYVEAKEAMEIFERLRGLKSPETLSSMTTYAICLKARGEGQKALGLLRRSSAVQEQMLGPDHPDTLRSLSRLAWTLHKQQEFDEAEGLQRKILSLRGHSLGLTYSLALRDMVNLAVTLISLGKDEEAEEICCRALLIQEKTLVTDHSNTTSIRYNLAWCLSRRKKYDEAIEQYRHVLSLGQRLLGANHCYTLKCRRGLAWCLYNETRYDEAVQHYRLVFASTKKAQGPEDEAEAQECRAEYARCLCMSGNSDEAIEQYQLVFSSSAWLNAIASVDILRRRHSFAWCLSNSKRYNEAVEQYRIVLALRDQVRENPDSEAIRGIFGVEEELAVRQDLASCLSKLGRYDEAIEQYRIVLASRNKLSATSDSRGTIEVVEGENELAFCLSQLAVSRDDATSAGEDKCS